MWIMRTELKGVEICGFDDLLTLSIYGAKNHHERQLPQARVTIQTASHKIQEKPL